MIAYYKTEVPFLRLIVFFIIGITISITYNLAPSVLYNSLFYLFSFSLIVSALLYKTFKLYLKRDFIGILLYLTLVLAGIVITNQHKQIYHDHHFSKHPSQELLAVITEQPKVKGDVARFIVEVKSNVNQGKINPSKGKLLVALRFDTTKNLNLHYGDLIILKSKYRITEPAYNPAEFNYRRYLSFQNIYHQTFINQKQVSIVDTDQGNPLIDFALKFRETQVVKFNQLLENDEAKAVASTLILGYRADLDKSLLSTYSNTGTMHVLSVSGMHVAIVVLLLNYLLSFMDRHKQSRIIKTVLIISLVWFYALVTGLAPSVTRAALMISFVLIAKSMARPVNIFNVLAISAFILLLYNPFTLLNVGFQLSYLAVGGLIYMHPKIASLYHTENKVIKFIWSVMAVSMAAQIATAPFSLYYFHQFPVYFILSNVFIVVPATLIMYLGFAFLIVASYLPQISIIGDLLNASIIFTNNGLKVIEQIPHANITQVWLNSFEIILCYLLIFLLFLARSHVYILRLALLCGFVLIVSVTAKEFNHIQQKNVLFFSLRKNTAVAFIKGRNAVVVTDLAHDEFTYLFSVKPYLDSCHVNNVSFVNPHLNKGETVYQFQNKSLKIINHSVYKSAKSSADWLLLSSDKVLDLVRISALNKFQHLLIDGKNRDFVIDGLGKQADELGLNHHVLKRKYALEYKL